ncbi:hypothetical protein HOY34_18630 [Xinfangfangia sp. D13-10-4-6]|uniref:hypothetical protein n=1 Tax=Pseudogemmobacter hezensis TaxID=2737662 RepID=UPI001551808D|nr:hypothetical protein [Pseudogemmobacter hezensis]NPD17209.1 hypothetical protein [Pseudogemmobacter hezensis]
MSFSKTALFAIGLSLALPAAGNAFIFSSTLPEFQVSGGDAVTDNPVGIQAQNECYPASDDLSEPGKILADGDWVVTSEVSFYDFELVSFAAIATPKEGGACEFFDGKIAVWKDGAFVALIEEGVADQLLIGHIRPVDGTVVEIRSGAAQPETVGYVAYDAAAEELFLSKTP